MGRPADPQTLRSLIEAGHAVLADEGLSKFTLNAVVCRTKLSKGALLHHFKSMDDFALRLMDEAISGFDALVRELRGDDESPGSYTRAYINAALRPATDPERRVLFESMAELARDAKLKKLFSDAVSRWSRLIESDGLDPARAQLLRLAADGLWLGEAADAKPVGTKLRRRLTAMMLEMTHPTE